MDEELKLEISKIISLANEPEAMLHDCQPSGSQAATQSNSSQNESSEKGKKSTDICKMKQFDPINFRLSKRSRKYIGMMATEFHFRIRGDKVVAFCQENGLIAKEVICSCGQPMQLESTVKDAYAWTCNDDRHNVKPHQSIRRGTWFEDATLPIGDILFIAYMWVHEYSIPSMLHESGASQKTLFDWLDYCLDMCCQIMVNKKEPIGGNDRSVEIFECKIFNGKEIAEEWALCAIEQYSTNILHLIVDNRQSHSLTEIFSKYILPETQVVTHIWTPLKNLNLADFEYLTKEKSIKFFDQASKKSLDVFQDFKRVTKRPPPGLNRWSKLEYGPGWFEKMYRKSLTFSPDAYLTFLNDTSAVVELALSGQKVGD